MDYRQWRAHLLDKGHAVNFTEVMGTPLVLATEIQISIYIAREGLSETMDRVEEPGA